MSRLLKFLRSILPADPSQLIFLGGIVCLIAGAHLRWLPAAAVAGLFETISEQSRHALGIFLVLAMYPILFAVGAGYFVCLWPGRRPLLRIASYVCLPVIAAIGLVYGRLLLLQQPRTSVLDRGTWLPQNSHSALTAFWSLGLGFRFTLLGLFLIVFYMSRLAFGISNLPIAVPSTSLSPGHDDAAWQPTRQLIWFLVAWCYTVVGLVGPIAMTSLETVVIHLAHRAPGPWALDIGESAGSWALVFFAIFLIGSTGWQDVKRAMRWCHPRYLASGALLAFAVSAVVSVGQYVFDRVDWVAHSFGTTDAPQFGTYFSVPGAALLLLFVPALSEEIIFRGLLQPLFIDRYGLYRGLFLVGIVWAAYHFFSDFSYHFGVQQVLLRLGFRIVDCVVLAYVFGWLTLRSGSVLPSAVCHTVANILVFSPLAPQ